MAARRRSILLSMLVLLRNNIPASTGAPRRSIQPNLGLLSRSILASTGALNPSMLLNMVSLHLNRSRLNLYRQGSLGEFLLMPWKVTWIE